MFIAIAFGEDNSGDTRVEVSPISAEDAHGRLSALINECADDGQEQLKRILVFDSTKADIHSIEDAWGASWLRVENPID